MATDKVLHFPAVSARTWADTERTLKAMIRDPAAAAFVAARLKVAFDAAWFEAPAAVDLSVVVDQFHRSTASLIEHLAAAYLEVYKARHV